MRKEHRIFAVLLFLCVSCGGRQLYEFKGATMGTTYSVKVVLPSGKKPPSGLDADILKQTESINLLMSNWLADSEISRFNRYSGTEQFEVSKDTATVIANALLVAKLTDGAFDPTLNPLIELWGFGAREKVVFPSDDAIAEALNKVGYQHISLADRHLRKAVADVTLNLSANAKGYAVDMVAQLLQEKGLTDFMVEIGGEIRVSGKNAEHQVWRLAIQDPRSQLEPKVLEVVEIEHGSLATSGDYRNFFVHEGKRYAHILDASTGKPVPPRTASVSVVAPDCMTADALATGFMVLEPERSLAITESLPKVECFILVREGESLSVRQSSGMAKWLKTP